MEKVPSPFCTVEQGAVWQGGLRSAPLSSCAGRRQSFFCLLSVTAQGWCWTRALPQALAQPSPAKTPVIWVELPQINPQCKPVHKFTKVLCPRVLSSDNTSDEG